MELTGNLRADEKGEDKKRIIERYTFVFYAVGLKANGGVDTTCPRSDICRHEIIYVCSVLSSIAHRWHQNVEQHSGE